MEKLELLKSTVLNSQDKNELYVAEVELTELSSSLHKAIRMADTEMEQSEAKGHLSLATSLIGICRERQQEVGNWANKVNYHFRMAAKVMLSKETYKKIWEKAQLTRQDVKDDKKELRANRLE